MIIAIGLYQGFTALDAIGPYEVLTCLPGAEMVICAEDKGAVDDHNDLVHLGVDATFADVPRPDVLLVPGGPVAGQYAAEGTRSSTGSVRPTRTLRGRRRYAPARSCSAPPDC
jgi:putative intracellular protease/amidase